MDLDTLDIRGLFRDHVFGCFIDDAHGIASIDEIGEDNIMCETDYPHSDSTWPELHRAWSRSASAISPPRSSTRSCAAMPRGSTASRRPSLLSPPVPEPAGLPAISIDRDVCMGSGLCLVYAAAPSPTTARRRPCVVDPVGDSIESIRIAVEACPTRGAEPVSTQEQERKDKHKERERQTGDWRNLG